MNEASAIARDPSTDLVIRKLTDEIGAVAEGVNLCEPLDDATFKANHAAVTEQQAIFFRNRHLTERRQKAVALRFGTPGICPAQRIAGCFRAITTTPHGGAPFHKSA